MSLSEFIAKRAETNSTGRASLGHVFDSAANRVAALIIFAAALPILGLIAGLLYIQDGSPLVFGHYRVGKSGRLFKCFKFRTMIRNSDQVLVKLLQSSADASVEWERDRKLRNDPRITAFGGFLRRTSLDELPQLVNVIVGDMNLVGPRPITVPELSRYGIGRWQYLSVRPGITGLWQISGRNDVTYEQRVALDRQYVEQRSIWLDIRILIATIVVVVRRDGAR